MVAKQLGRLVPRPLVRSVRRVIRREVALAVGPREAVDFPAHGAGAPRTIVRTPWQDEVLGLPHLLGTGLVTSPFAENLAFPRFSPTATTPDDLPVPPVERWTVVEDYLESGQRDVEALRGIIQPHGCTLQTGTRVLDFGCGPARMLRWLPRDIDGWGVDLDADDIAWCQRHLSPPFRFATCTTVPHLPFEDHRFDLVYAGSVFTHLSELADTWLLELLRIVRPGGLLYLTVHEQATLAFLRKITPDDPLRTLTGATFPEATAAAFEKWSAELGDELDGFTLGRGYAAQVFYDRDAIVAHWARYADVLEVVPEAYGFHQTAIVLRRTSD